MVMGTLAGHLQTPQSGLPKEPRGICGGKGGFTLSGLSRLGRRSKIPPHITVTPREKRKGPQQVSWELHTHWPGSSASSNSVRKVGKPGQCD